MAKTPQNPALKLLHRLADADMAFWTLPPLMLLLVAGTIVQRWMGLWPAIDTFFSGFIIWFGPLPLPGAYTLLGLLSLNLILKFLLKSDWRLIKSGIHLAHLGAIILLFGGLITAISAKEHYMLIPEGDETPYIYSYTDRSLTIYKDGTEILRRPFKNIRKGALENVPFTLKITDTCKNADILKREDSPAYDTDQTYQGMANFMALKCRTRGPEPETDLTGLEFEISGTDQDGIYIAFDGMPQPIELTKDGQSFRIMFGKDQDVLPFSIKLDDFVEQTYSGTNIARSYHSDITIRDESTTWPARIEMNEPLRYKGYTLFQSSFEKAPGFEATILAVVQNKGWIFPYLGTLLLALGLLLHLVLVVYERKVR